MQEEAGARAAAVREGETVDRPPEDVDRAVRRGREAHCVSRGGRRVGGGEHCPRVVGRAEAVEVVVCRRGILEGARRHSAVLTWFLTRVSVPRFGCVHKS